jgi:hypothetical protein
MANTHYQSIEPKCFEFSNVYQFPVKQIQSNSGLRKDEEERMENNYAAACAQNRAEFAEKPRFWDVNGGGTGIRTLDPGNPG